MYPHHLHTPNRPVCCNSIATPPGKLLVDIILLKKEIYNDIDADTLQVEKARKIEDLTIATDEKQRYTLTRTIEKAITNVLQPLTPYLLLPSPFVHTIATNHAGGWDEKDILLAMPNNWPPHLIDSLRDTVHHYIVKFAEYEYLAPLLPNDPYTAMCKQQYDDDCIDINVIVSSRLGPLRTHPTPFG